MDDLDPTSSEREAEFQRYVAKLDPLVAKVAPEVGDDRAFLGSLSSLLTSRAQNAKQATVEDRLWLSALEHVVHHHRISHELVTCTGADDTLWLVPPH